MALIDKGCELLKPGQPKLSIRRYECVISSGLGIESSPIVGVEPNIGAGDGIRTRDINLGKVALYQLSYSRAGGGLINILRRVCSEVNSSDCNRGA